ncbi:MAG TPA: chitobiase/beta-hexosaminidase C-terminal domain-containing protein, partial [Verrucomicrobiae bacterium]|nr:chitobiase/beta-hexosaminidase C-terminal domain-containing protein [Verrucomicrobiae bacterium]
KAALNRFVWLGLFFSFANVRAGAQAIDWPTLGFTQVVTNSFSSPIGITHAGDGSQRIFIVEQPGRVWIIQSNNVLAQPFLVITDRVTSAGSEQGLLGLAFPPGFSTKKYFYVDYTRQSDGAIAISRFFLTATNLNVADINSEQPVMVIPKPSPITTYNNHNAGQLAFGPDGDLYIGVGDGGSEGDPLTNGQNTANLFGKILRIDVESGAWPYAIPADNPYVSSSGYAPEIWAYGLRNPWRFSFDDQTGDLYIGDVGQNSYEEIDFQPAGSAGGQNYGWRIMEGYSNFDIPPGFTNFAALTLPVAAYPHKLPTGDIAAIIGGYVYRGPSQPRMDGMYFFGDFEAGWIWGLKQEGTNWQDQALVSPTDISTYFHITTFGEDDQRNLYLADYRTGLIYQIKDSFAAWTPTFSPTGGVINSSAVIVSSLTTNAQIHYTTNGVNPTISDPVVAPGGILTVALGIAYKAIAYRPDLTPSGVASAVYTSFKVATPVFSPAGPITNGTSISISCATPGATIYYTLDGTTPTTASPMYTGPFSINAGTTVEAFALETNYANSGVQSTNFQLVQTATPVFSPPAGALRAGTLIFISCSTPGSAIFYTVDGTTPTTNSMLYSGPITFETNFVLNALGYVNGFNNNSVVNGSYTLAQVAAPVFHAPYGPITNGTPISLSSATLGSTIYYTLDGSTPTTNSLVYSGPFAVNGGMTVAAFATAKSYANSTVTTSKYYLKSMENTVVTTFASGLSSLWGICVDQNGNLYVAIGPTGNICKISPSGQSTNIASIYGSVCIDSAGNLFVGDGNNQIWKVQPDGTTVGIAQLGGEFTEIYELAVDPGDNIYVGYSASVQKVTSAGTVIPFATTNGWNTQVGVGMDAATNIYARTGNGVWKVAQNGAIVLYAGGNFGYADGPALSALFQYPYGAVAVDPSTNVFVIDESTIRKISPAGYVSTMAGSVIAGYLDGPGSIALFNRPLSLCVDTNENIFVADTDNNCIREISPDTCGIGIADWWQLKYFGHIGIDPNSDPNNNGLTAYDDFWAGLNPTNPASVFKIESATFNRNGTQISWDTVSGKNYAVQRSSDLVSWTTIASSIAGTGSIASYTDTIPSRTPEFYRIVVSF